MRSKRALTWIMVVIMGLPQALLWSAASAAGAREVRPGVRSDTDVHQALSDAALAAAWGGSHPVAKIGTANNSGFLVIRRPDNTCPPNYISIPVLPSHAENPDFNGPTPGCRASIPRFTPFTDVRVDIGGDVADIQENGPGRVEVWVNGVLVPPSDLGPEFLQACPRLPAPYGSAFVPGWPFYTIALYDCDFQQSFNAAVVPYRYLLRGAFNVITVRYRLGTTAFEAPGDDIDSRVIYVEDVG